jgi:putative salt-induced outer membrane protein YdiY
MRFARTLSLLLIVALWAAGTAYAQSPSLLPPPSYTPTEALPPQVSVAATLAAPSAVTTTAEVPAAATIPAAQAPAATVSEPLPTPAEAAGIVASEAAGAGVGTGIDLEEPQPWYKLKFLVAPVPWDTGIELGINGSSGTSEAFSMRTGGYIKRESRFSKLDMSTYYNRTSTGGIITQNNATFDIRNDWLLDDKSPWTLFATNNVFYDEFKAFDLQTNVDAGVGYRVFHEKELQLVTRVGAGTSREFGGPDDRWVPESLFGFEFNQQLSLTQKFYGKLDYFPEWDQVGEFRMVADMGWEVVLVQPSNLSLKISAQDRFDSTPNGAEPNLVNYSALLLLKL